MKIFFQANFGDRKRLRVEGMLSVIDVLYKGLKKKFEIVSDAEQADVTHAHSSGFFEAINNQNSPIIYSVHAYLRGRPLRTSKDIFDWYRYTDCFFKKDFSRSLLFFSRFFTRLLSYCIPVFVKRYFLKKMDVVVVSSELAKKELGLDNVRVIPHAIQEKRFALRKQNKNVTVAYAGHTTPAKGIIEVVKAFAQINYQTDMYLILTPKKFLRHVKKYSPKTKVHGRVKDVAEIYKKSDIMLLPFRHENAAIATPLVLIEAMASGCAIVTTDLPHLRALCGDSALYVKLYDVDAMVRAVNRLAKDSVLRKKLGAKARKRALQNHAEKDMVVAYEKLYGQFV